MEILNDTPYVAEPNVMLNPRGEETLIVTVKGTWAFADDGTLQPAEEPLPIVVADEFAGEPGASSVTRASEIGLPRPATDVVLLGSARARRGEKSVVVTLQCGPVKKSVRVTGARRWSSAFGLPRLSGAEPVDGTALLWENAFGGTDETARAWWPENPVGRGFRGKGSKSKWDGTEAPNLEHPAHPIGGPGEKGVTAGFGYVAPHWQPRVAYAGTYDDAWLERRAPLLPDDFDPRFQHVAPADQIVPGRLRGGEPVAVEGAGPRGALRGALPREFPVATVLFEDEEAGLPLPLDEVAVHADAGLLTLLWKGALSVERRVHRVEGIEIAIAASRRSRA